MNIRCCSEVFGYIPISGITILYDNSVLIAKEPPNYFFIVALSFHIPAVCKGPDFPPPKALLIVVVTNLINPELN